MGKKNRNKKKEKIIEESEDSDEIQNEELINNLPGFNLSIPDRKYINQDFKNVDIENFSISTPKKQIFESTNLTLSYGNKYGLVGPNGKGKTTLLNHISKRVFPINEKLDILHVEQEVEASDRKVINVVLDANTKRVKIEKEINFLEQKMDLIEDDNKATEMFEKINELREELIFIGSEKDESKVRKILYGLGFSSDEQDKSTSSFSGGWRMRISIAKALYMEPTLLLLDEPTNHLDLNAVIWLTNYLINWKKTLLIVSHNQYFLNDVCSHIYHINALKLDLYKGNYFMFQKSLKQKRKNDEKEWTKIEKKVKEMKNKSETKKKIQEFLDNCGIKRPEKEYIVNISFGESSQLIGKIFSVDNVSFSYNNDKVILQNIDFGIDLDSRITIVGPNGAGKSTFINLLVGNLEPTSGEIYRNRGIKIAYYNQHFVDVLPMDMNPIDFLRSKKDLPEQEIRKKLGTIGLEPSAHLKLMSELSGGQKSRVVLVSCQLSDPHLLIMDEPTNHLDIESINGLIDAINDFDGGVILVSHDMELITRTDCVMWVCENKQIYRFEGDYDDYRDHIINQEV